MASKAVLEERMTLMFEQNSKEHEEIKKLIDDFICNADKKFASKLSEKIVYGMVGTIVVAFFARILNLI